MDKKFYELRIVGCDNPVFAWLTNHQIYTDELGMFECCEERGTGEMVPRTCSLTDIHEVVREC